MKQFISITLILLISSGCASLAINDTDSAGKKVGKVTTRLGLGIITIAISEVFIGDAKMQRDIQYAEQQTQEAYDNLVAALKTPGTPKNEIAVLELEFYNKLRKEEQLRIAHKRYVEEMSAAISGAGESIGQGISAGYQQRYEREQQMYEQDQLNDIESELDRLNRKIDNMRRGY